MLFLIDFSASVEMTTCSVRMTERRGTEGNFWANRGGWPKIALKPLNHKGNF